MKILFVCRAFGGVVDGIGRQAIFIMEEMISKGHEVNLITWDKDDAQGFYQMPKDMRWLKLNAKPEDKTNCVDYFKQLLSIRKHVRAINPDIIIGFQHRAFFPVRLACTGLSVPVLLSERDSVHQYRYIVGFLKRMFIVHSMVLADRITVQCPSYVKDYPFYMRHKIVVIPNLVLPAKIINSDETRDKNNKILLSVGRLCFQKNMTALVNAFIRISPKLPEWKLHIAGEGCERQQIEKIIIDANMADKVILLGAVKNVHELYASSHLFCLASWWEGFSNAIAESLACGLPCVAYEGCPGMKDLIEDGSTGQLAQGNGNVETLANALYSLMDDDVRREAMGVPARISMKQYTKDKVIILWSNLFKTVVP